MTRTYRIDDGRQTLVLAATHDRLPQVVYWGAPLPMGENLGTLHAAHVIDVTGGMLDENPDLSLCPEAARSFPGQPGLILRDADGARILAILGTCPRARITSPEWNSRNTSVRPRP